MFNKQHPRFATVVRKWGAALTVLSLGAMVSGPAFAGDTLNRIRDSGHVRFAYLPQAKPSLPRAPRAPSRATARHFASGSRRV